jgi:hypothetical protein
MLACTAVTGFRLISISFVMLPVMLMHLAFLHWHFHVHHVDRGFNFPRLTKV